MTNTTPTRAQRFAAVVVAAAERAGYTGHGAKARFSRDTGMVDSSVTRLWQGKSLPDPRFYPAIAKAVGLPLSELLVEGGVLSLEALQSLSETDRPQVSSHLTPEKAARGLGINDPVGIEMFEAVVNRLQHDGADRQDRHDLGGDEAQSM